MCVAQGYYDAIRHSPFQYHEGSDELSEVFFNPDHQGYLTKEGGKHKSWRKRWFILTDNCLYYFKSPSDKEPLGIIPLENLEVRECTDTRKNVSVYTCSFLSSMYMYVILIIGLGYGGVDGGSPLVYARWVKTKVHHGYCCMGKLI